jgi:flagellar protein FlaI
MLKKVAICPNCETRIECVGEPGDNIDIQCSNCGKKGSIVLKTKLIQLDFYPLNEPYAYAKILKNTDTLEKKYKLIEPFLSEDDQKLLNYIWETLLKTLELRLDELDLKRVENYLMEQIDTIFDNYQIKVDEITKKKIIYYIKRESLGYGKIDPIMKDPNIEDISCDGSNVPIFLFHRKYGSLKSNIIFNNEEELSFFVVRLAQKCGKHISIAEPMLDATIPDGSRIQMTLSNEVTTKGSTFTIRRFKADPITTTDLIGFNTVNSEILAYLWMGVENGVNALIAGGTASGKTTILNAMSLFIPRDSKIVSIEETREINLPHPNWIPGVSRSGFGEVVADKMVGEIDLYDLMKAALRQRPEYILVGEIRGKEAYVLFQAMATGHTTYSTVHADSAKSLIHRLEGKPIDIPRVMLQSLDIVSIHITTRVKGKRVRRCKQIIEILDVDPTTKEILTNEVFRWDPVEDKFLYTGKSYVLEGIRARWDMSKSDISEQIRQRADILDWMKETGIRTYNEVAKVIAQYRENPNEFYNKIKQQSKKGKEEKDKDLKIEKEKELEKDVKDKIVDSIVEKESIKNLKSIDNKTARILIAHDISTVDDLKNNDIKDIIKIKGIKKNVIKRALKEIEKPKKAKRKKNDKKKQHKDLEPEKIKKERKNEKKWFKKRSKKEIINEYDEEKQFTDQVELNLTQQQNISVPEVKEDKSFKEKIDLEPKIESKEKKKFRFFNKKKSKPSVQDTADLHTPVDQKIAAFKDIRSIDEKIAILLYDNGIKSVQELRKIPIKELTKIKGIKRGTIKKIIKELEKIPEEKLIKTYNLGGEIGGSK